MVFIFPVIAVMRTLTMDPSSSIIFLRIKEGLKCYSPVKNDLNTLLLVYVEDLA